MNDKITGLMVYYYHVCKRKLWLSNHGISLESENENVEFGKYIDEYTYQSKRKHLMINNEINLDFIESGKIIHEVKKSRKIEEASIWQVKYYLYYLKKLGVEGVTAKIDYPLLKQIVEVSLDEGDVAKIEEKIQRIKEIVSKEIPLKVEKKSICKKCAYYDLCMV